MQSGFPIGGAPELYGGRSMLKASMNPPQPNPYRTQISGVFLDPSPPIARQGPTTFIGKRTLADFQAQQQNIALGNLFLRSVKARNFQQASPISPLSPVDISSTMSLPPSEAQSQRLFGGGGPTGVILRKPNSQPAFPVNGGNFGVPMGNSAFQGVPHLGMVQARVMAMESEKKMINHRLQELEKQLLDDNDEDDCGDAVSVITNTNSEWSETIQNLMVTNTGQNPKSISPSPASSTSSSSSSPSVGSPASGCWKQSVIEVASAISERKLESAAEILARLAPISDPKRHSEQRLMECVVFALKSRLNPVENPPAVCELFSPEHIASTQLLYDMSPCFKLGLMAANLSILEATKPDDRASCNKLHVVDFDIGQGSQYKNLLHGLSARQNGKPAIVKLTSITENSGDEERLKKVGEWLSKLAERSGVSFKFNLVNQRVGELTRDSLGCDPDEALAVNFAFKLSGMPDESVSTENPRDTLLRRVKSLSPQIVTLVEREINTNTAPFTTRVADACAYHGSLFDSINSTVGRDNPDRVKLEEVLGRWLVNSVACDGRDRVERCEVFGKWRARMGMAGFELKPLSQSVTESMRTRLSSGGRVHPGFTVKEENGGVCFGWMGRTVTVASAWR